MATRIEVNVDQGGLLQRNRQQTAANRQAQLERNAIAQAAESGRQQKEQQLAGENRTASGAALSSSTLAEPLRDRPAAQRLERESFSMGWVVVTDNDWSDGDKNTNGGSLIDSYTGSNSGRTLYISSSDGTSWLTVANIETTKAPVGFEPGDKTGKGESVNGIWFDTSVNLCEFDVFPAGRGNYVLVFRFHRAFAKAWWVVTGASQTNFGGADDFTDTSYRAFLVKRSSVTEITVPDAVKSYFQGKFFATVARTKNYRRYSDGFSLEWYPQPNPNRMLISDFGGGADYGLMDYRNDGFRSSQLHWWLNGWWQTKMQAPSDSIALSRRFVVHGAPAIFSRAANSSTNWPNYITPLNADGTLNTTEYSTWLRASYSQDQSRMKQPAAYYTPTYASLFDSKLNVSLPIYTSLAGDPSGWTGWLQAQDPRVPPSDTSQWRLTKTLTFRDTATGYPTLAPSVNKADYFCVCRDWGVPAYCRSQLIALGFNPLEIT